MPVKERIKVFYATEIEKQLEEQVNNFLANNEEIDDFVDFKIMTIGNSVTSSSNNTSNVANIIGILIYRKKEEGGFSFG
jgi:hypothetical protein